MTGGKASKKDVKAAKKGGKEEVVEEKETTLGTELKLAISREKEMYNERIDHLRINAIKKVK